MSTTVEKLCLSCEKPLKGRSDKKFCDDWCRNAYNNKVYSEDSVYMRQVNSILRKNRKALSSFFKPGEETAKTSKQKLMDAGMNFSYFTNTYVTKKGTVYYYCYEFGYLPIEGDYYFLVKSKK